MVTCTKIFPFDFSLSTEAITPALRGQAPALRGQADVHGSTIPATVSPGFKGDVPKEKTISSFSYLSSSSCPCPCLCLYPCLYLCPSCPPLAKIPTRLYNHSTTFIKIQNPTPSLQLVSAT